jgi:hypothetical protein
MRYKKLTETEFQDINDCESEYNGAFFCTAEEVAFDHQVHFNEPPKLIVVLLDNGFKTRI